VKVVVDDYQPASASWPRARGRAAFQASTVLLEVLPSLLLIDCSMSSKEIVETDENELPSLQTEERREERVDFPEAGRPQRQSTVSMVRAD